MTSGLDKLFLSDIKKFLQDEVLNYFPVVSGIHFLTSIFQNVLLKGLMNTGAYDWWLRNVLR